jgi:hypothetical protein
VNTIALKEKGYTVRQISQKLRMPVSTVYYQLNNPPKSRLDLLGDDFHEYKWQVLLGAVASSRACILARNGTCHIQFNHHAHDLKYLIWKARTINEINVFKACEHVMAYRGQQIRASYNSLEIGSILKEIDAKRCLFHPVARFMYCHEVNMEVRAEARPYQEAVEAVVLHEAEQNKTTRQWLV